MASRTIATAKPALLPPAMVAFLRRRLTELAGMVLLAGAGFLVLALGSFDPADPSINTATSRAAANLAGVPGAYAADLILQLVGAAAVVPILALIAWGWRLVGHRGLTQPWSRLALLIIALVVAAAAGAALPTPAGWQLPGGLGGATGATVVGALMPLVARAGVGEAAFVAVGLTASLALLGLGLGLTGGEWRTLGRRLLWLMALPWRGAGALVSRLVRGGARREKREKRTKRSARHDPSERIEPRLFKRADAGPNDGATPRRRAPAVRRDKAKLVAPRASRRAAHQEMLELAPHGEYQLPPLSLLTLPPDHDARAADNEAALTQNARLLEAVLDDFGVRGEIVKVHPGPVVTLYELEPVPGTKSSRVIGLADDIARSMSAVSVRVALIPGRSVIGIELPSAQRETVYLRELLSSPDYESTAARLTLALGKDIGGAPVMCDLARMPHMLVAGTTGSGKSVAINSMILSLVFRLPPDQCKFILIDPKMLELSVYDDIPHLLAPVVTDAATAVTALKWTVREMENRYRALSHLGVRNITSYNKRLAETRSTGGPLTRRVQTGFDRETGKPVFEDQELPSEPLPHIVVIVDEMADLMLLAGREVEGTIQRLAQMARAAGIHLIMATQRPSVDVITGTIKANFSTRISFQVTSKIDSRTILGEQGAEQLLGDGDMLYMSSAGRVTRVHGPYVSEAEVARVVAFLKTQGTPEYIDEITEEDFGPAPRLGGNGEDDLLYDQAVALACRERKASTSFIQRHLQIGYNRAARIIERMEAEGVVSRANHVGRREVLVGDIADDRQD